jgi:cell division protein FtsX
VKSKKSSECKALRRRARLTLFGNIRLESLLFIVVCVTLLLQVFAIMAYHEMRKRITKIEKQLQSEASSQSPKSPFQSPPQ